MKISQIEGCFLQKWIAGILVAQDFWIPKDAKKSIKGKKAALGPLHLATTSTKVARTEVWSQVTNAVMESK